MGDGVRKQLFVFLALVVMLLGIPVAAQAGGFCSSLNEILADVPNNFRTNVQLTDFTCSPLGSTAVVYQCSKPTQDNIIAVVKKCLPGWHISLDTDGVLMMRTEDVGMTVSVSRSKIVDGKPTVSVAIDKRGH
jgi:hypothetical protein